MKNKAERLQTIKELVLENRIGSQDELLKMLEDKGFSLTQATLSRDLKQMQIAKVAGPDGWYMYVLPETAGIGKIVNAKADNRYRGVSPGFLSIEYSGNLAVMKTRPGYASGIAYDIDYHNPNPIIGTIAGDDTVLLILREDTDRNEVERSLSVFIPGM